MRKNLFIPVIAFVIALGLYGIAVGQEHGHGKEVTLQGNLIDKHCSSHEAGTHDKGCIVAKPCADSGLGIFADGKWHAFDKAGSAKALDALKASKKDKGAVFKVTGTLEGETLTLKSIQEVGGEE